MNDFRANSLAVWYLENPLHPRLVGRDRSRLKRWHRSAVRQKSELTSPTDRAIRAKRVPGRQHQPMSKNQRGQCAFSASAQTVRHCA